MSGSLSGLWDKATNFLGISGSPSMQGADFSSMADAGYTVPSASDMSTASNFSGSANPTDWSKISSSLKDLSKQLGGDTGAGTGTTGNTGTGSSDSSSATSQASSSIGHPSNPQSMTNLVNALKSRQQAYMTAATDPSKSGTPVVRSQYTGLLGF